MEVGGAILEFKVNPDDGTVTRSGGIQSLLHARFFERYIRSDVKLVSGRLKIKP